jgi:hypothetical protein
MWALGGLMTALFISAPLPASAHALDDSAHLSVSTTDAKGHVGDTVSIRVTVTNHGPDVEPEWALTSVRTQAGTKFVSGTGCRPDPDGRGQYCPSPGPLAAGKSQTVVLRYKIVHTLPHPDWEIGGFSFYEALNRKTNTDDLDLSFHISILGTKPSTTRTPANAHSTPTRTPTPRRTAPSTPSQAGTTTASEATGVLAAPETDPTPSRTAAVLPKLEDAGFTNSGRTAWAVAAGGIGVIGFSALILLAVARRRARTAAPDNPAL